jgi:hypothetical protein
VNLTRDFPWWMHTRWGRWLCWHWRPAAVYWQALIHSEIARRARAEAEHCGGELQLAAGRCVEREFDDESRWELVRTWCNWRNAVDREIGVADEIAQIAEAERATRK